MLRLFLCFLLFGPTAWAKEQPGFNNETSLGYVVTGGNSQSETTSLTEKASYRWERDILKINGHYIQTSGQMDTPTAGSPNATDLRTTAENWSATLRFEKVIQPDTFNLFIAHGWYGDRFQGIRYGHASDIGAKYYVINSETLTQHIELGYRYARELLTQTPTAKVGVRNSIMPEYHYGRLFAQIDYSHSKTLSLGAWIEYLPSVTNFAEDQRLNYSPYLTSVLTDTFSLKVSYEGRYRYKPAQPGNKLTDYTFTTALIAKF